MEPFLYSLLLLNLTTSIESYFLIQPVVKSLIGCSRILVNPKPTNFCLISMWFAFLRDLAEKGSDISRLS